MRARHSNPNHSLAVVAHALRASATISERALWAAIGSGKTGVSFRRQVPLLGRFVVDFFAPSICLVIEVDGGYHRECQRADARRQRALEAARYRVLRLEAAVVMQQMEEALRRIRAAVAQAR